MTSEDKQLYFAKEDIDLETYLNTREVGKITVGRNREIPIYLPNIGIAAILGGLNQIYIGRQSTGKTQLARDIRNSFFGGQEYSLWEEGRADFTPKRLFERLNISAAKGANDLSPKIETLYGSDNKMHHFVEAFKTIGKDIKRFPKEISREEAEQIKQEFAITTDVISELKNINKKFFVIDEYNRCPEVVMNMFYGLMNGELINAGEIVKLGNGYYSGIAAVNPSGDQDKRFTGTFTIDPAMISRFHVAIDFTAFPITEEDDFELMDRNMSPKVQNAQIRDRYEQVLKTFEKIKGKQPTEEERIILVALGSGMNHCPVKGKSKEHIDWPRECMTNKECASKSKICGQLKGLDIRSRSAVFRLAKGIEEIVRIQEQNEDLEINPVESMLLAYQFVAPFKGILNPKTAKEALHLEGLVMKEHANALKGKYNAQMKKIAEHKRLTRSEDVRKYRTLESLSRQFEKEGTVSAFEQVISETEKKYTQQKKLTPAELKKESPQDYERIVRDELLEHKKLSLENCADSLIELAEAIQHQDQDKLVEFRKQSQNGRLDEKDEKGYYNALDSIKKIIIDGVKDNRQLAGLFKMTGKEYKGVESKAEQKLPEKLIEYIPQDAREEMEKEEISTLQGKLREILAKKEHHETRDLFKDEFGFLERTKGKW